MRQRKTEVAFGVQKPGQPQVLGIGLWSLSGLMCMAMRPGANSLLFSRQRVGADPGVGHRQPGGQVEGWQERGEGAFQQVGVATDGVFGLAHVGALGEEAHVVGWRMGQGRGGVREGP